MQNNVKKELILGIGIIFLVILMTIISVKKIHQREDLAFLQINFTNSIVGAKLCLENKGVIQDPSQGDQGKVFICSRQEIVKDTFPVLQKLSKRNIKYKYLSSKKCFRGACNKSDEIEDEVRRVNIGRGNKFVLSCDIMEGVCQSR